MVERWIFLFFFPPVDEDNNMNQLYFVLFIKKKNSILSFLFLGGWGEKAYLDLYLPYCGLLHFLD